jgi:hypothetical protein
MLNLSFDFYWTTLFVYFINYSEKDNRMSECERGKQLSFK